GLIPFQKGFSVCLYGMQGANFLGNRTTPAILHLETHFYESEKFGRICNTKHRNPGYPLQSFGCAKWISPAIPSTGPLAGNYRSTKVTFPACLHGIVNTPEQRKSAAPLIAVPSNG
ncbi:MAG: hypothetical protein LBF74_01070, partial [Treponema sp.]|nr:hypothetical protein [Treponema sp.]